jgi:hypothetical protein
LKTAGGTTPTATSYFGSNSSFSCSTSFSGRRSILAKIWIGGRSSRDAASAEASAGRPPGSQELAPPFYNAGLYVLRPSIFDFTAKLKPSPRDEHELTDAIRDLAPAYRQDGESA